MKKWISVFAAGCLALPIVAVKPVTAAKDVKLTIFNTKMEIQEQLLEMAEAYSASHEGVQAEVYYSSDTVAAHMATRYASNDPYVLSMVDAKDIYSLGAEHAVDLSQEDWVKDTIYAIGVNGQVKGFPVCIEARGLLYNADAIEAVTGEPFEPEKYETLDAFQELLQTLREGGMETPVVIQKEDWSLGAHYLQQVYEEREDVEGCIQALYGGNFDLAGDEKWNALMDTFDVLKENNYWAEAPISAEREISEMLLAQGDVAFMFGGNWDWSMINAYDYSENMGIMGLPQNTEDGSNRKLLGGGSKFFMIDSSDAISEEQREAAREFLNWIVFDPEGQEFIVNTCSLISPFSNNQLMAVDPLSASVKAYADADLLIPSYNYIPDDHYAKLGAVFQKYLAGGIDRDTFASEIVKYWKNAAPVSHE